MSKPPDQVAPSTSRKRKRFRFSLRTLLIATTLLSLWFGLVFSRVENERRAAEAISDAYGTIVYDWQVRPADSGSNFKPGPVWLRKYLGPHWFDKIVEVQLNEYSNPVSKNRFSLVGPHLVKLRRLRSLSLSLSSRNFDPDYYELLGRLPQLEKLRLHQETRINKQDFSSLAGAEGLRELHLDGVKITPEVLKELRKLRHLEVLDIDCFSFDSQTGDTLTEYQLRDEAAEVLATLPKLRSLRLVRTQITDAGMASLSRLSELKTLVVGSPNITSKSLDHVVKLQRLEHLEVWVRVLDEANLEKLLQLPNLKSLGLTNQLTDACVPYLAKLEHLEGLTLTGEGITDASIHHFLQLKKLDYLNLKYTSVNKHGSAAKQLQQALPNCNVNLPQTEREKEMERTFHLQKRGGKTMPSQLKLPTVFKTPS